VVKEAGCPFTTHLVLRTNEMSAPKITAMNERTKDYGIMMGGSAISDVALGDAVMEPPPRAEPGKSTAAAIWDGAAFGLADAAAEIRTELQKETEERLQEVGAALNERLKDQLAESFENVAAQYPCCESLPLAPLLGAAVSAVASVARGGVDEKLCKQLAVLVDRHGSDSKLLLTQCPSWRRLVAPFALLQQSPAPLSALVMTLCVVVTVWGLVRIADDDMFQPHDDMLQ